MRPTAYRGAVAPSLPLLQFLHAQAEELCFSSTAAVHSFFTPSTIASCSHSIASRDQRASRTKPIAPLEACALNLSILSGNSQPLRKYWRNFSPPQQASRSNFRYQRWMSNESKPFFKRLTEYRRKPQERAKLKRNDLPALSGDSSGSVFGRSKATNELKLRCTEFDENGNVTLVNGEFKKSELMTKYGLLPRDLRKIDSSLLPSILVRPSAILVNLLHLRVLIKHNRVLVFDAYGSTDSFTQSVFMYDLEGKLTQKEASRAITGGGLPYEFRALEAVLISVTSGLEGEFEGIREPVVQVLRELEEDIDRDMLRHLLVYSKKLGTFEQKARLVRDAIESILEEDEDLSAMYLSESAQGQARDKEDHTEIEMLLESYHKVCDEIVQNSGNLVSNIRNTEEIIKAILDANRNSLMLLDLKFSIGTLGMGSGAFVAALYGMNLKNFIEESDLGFWGISGLSAFMAGVVCVYGLQKLRRVQRISMWGEQGRVSRGNWRKVDAFPQEGRSDRFNRLREERELWSASRGALIRSDPQARHN